MDVARLSDAELADAMATLRRLVTEESGGPEAVKEMEAWAERLIMETLDGFAAAYHQMVSVIGVENAYNFASQFIQRADLKPTPRPRGKADPERTARLLAAYDAASAGQHRAAVGMAAGAKTEAEIDRAMRLVEREIKARDDRRKVLEDQRIVFEVIRDWPPPGGEGDKK